MIGEEGSGEAVSQSCVGERLRAAREARGLSVEDIAAGTRIPTRHLRTIESCAYDGLPATTYSAGFIKSWARLLGLDGQTLSEEFRAEMSGAAVQSAPSLPYEPADPRRTPPIGLAILALLIAVIGGLGYLYWRGTAEDPTVIAAASFDRPAARRLPAASPAVAVAPAPASPIGPVVISASQDVWIRVGDAGKTLYLGLLHAGEHYQVPADAAAPLLTTGRPGNTDVTVGQTPIPPLGDPDRIARDVSLKPADLLARVAAPAPAVQPPANVTTPVDNAAGPA